MTELEMQQAQQRLARSARELEKSLQEAARESYKRRLTARAVEPNTVQDYSDDWWSFTTVGFTGERRLFYEAFCGEVFEADVTRVLNAEYWLNRKFILRGWVTLNDFYQYLGLPATVHGDMVGWDTGTGYNDYGYEWIDFQHTITTLDDGREVCEIWFPFEPTEDCAPN